MVRCSTKTEMHRTSLHYIDTSVLLKNAPLEIHTNHIRVSGGVFSISSLAKILMTSLILCLILKLYLNLLVYDRNIFGFFVESLRQSSIIFTNLRKCLENVHKRSPGLRKSSESGRKSSEIVAHS